MKLFKYLVLPERNISTEQRARNEAIARLILTLTMPIWILAGWDYIKAFAKIILETYLTFPIHCASAAVILTCLVLVLAKR